MKHKLDLLSNALDSLNEGLRRFIDAREGDARAYKFAVLHLAHFIELFLKHAVALNHPLLIYEKPSTASIKTAKTIGMWDAIQILRNAGKTVDAQLHADLEWLKKLRNAIEHYEFEMDVKEVRSALGRIIRAADNLSTSLSLPRLQIAVSPDCGNVLAELLDEYKEELANAKADAKRDSESKGVELTHCDMCGEYEVALIDKTKVQCQFCGGIEAIEDCAICSQPFRRSDMTVWNDDNPEDYIAYACEACERRIFDHD